MTRSVGVQRTKKPLIARKVLCSGQGRVPCQMLQCLLASCWRRPEVISIRRSTQEPPEPQPKLSKLLLISSTVSCVPDITPHTHTHEAARVSPWPLAPHPIGIPRVPEFFSAFRSELVNVFRLGRKRLVRVVLPIETIFMKINL